MEITVSEVMEIVNGIDTITNVSTIENDTHFEEAGLDSLDRMNLFLDIEERFKIKIQDEEFNKLNCIDDIISYLKNYDSNG